ncbi:hypothetical protein NC652_003050 [Populus alba x Populus x berolinensis]|nr:hypothetical protein NC652_003050 [Populus alba x Populus x berolinensis]
MNKELCANESILGLRDPNRPFPTGQNRDPGLLRQHLKTSQQPLEFLLHDASLSSAEKRRQSASPFTEVSFHKYLPHS